MLYSFFEQMSIVLENSRLEKQGNNQKKIQSKQKTIKRDRR